MNLQECANCATYGWKQVEDTTKLQKCSNCNLISYCGKECQTEHWKKLHKSHCRYFKEPSLAQPFYHRMENCALCLLEHQLKQPNNPNYMCTMDVFMKDDFLKEHYHSHPFPSAGAPGDTVEKSVIVLEHLVLKKIMIQPGNGDAALITAHGKLLVNRCIIWRNRKMFPQAKAHITRNLHEVVLSDIRLTAPDPFQLWKYIIVVNMIFVHSTFIRDLKAFKDPLDSLHAKFHSIIVQAMDNSTEYLSVADEVLQALASQVVPYEEILKIICGGSLKQRCSFCSKQVIISGIQDIDDSRSPLVYFHPLFVRIYGCGRNNCHDKIKLRAGDTVSLAMAITTTRKEREANQCDYCFQLPPTKDVHMWPLSHQDVLQRLLQEQGLGHPQARLQGGRRGGEEGQGWLVGQEGGGGGVKEGNYREARESGYYFL